MSSTSDDSVYRQLPSLLHRLYPPSFDTRPGRALSRDHPAGVCAGWLWRRHPLMVLPGTPAEAARGFQETLDNDLAAAAPIAVVEQKLARIGRGRPATRGAQPAVAGDRRPVPPQRYGGTCRRSGGSRSSPGGPRLRRVRLSPNATERGSRRRRWLPTPWPTISFRSSPDDPGPFCRESASSRTAPEGPEIWVMDWDGDNPKQLTKHGTPLPWPLSGPRTAIRFGLHLVSARNAGTLRTHAPRRDTSVSCGTKGGVNSSATFSPDGKNDRIRLEH